MASTASPPLEDRVVSVLARTARAITAKKVAKILSGQGGDVTVDGISSLLERLSNNNESLVKSVPGKGGPAYKVGFNLEDPNARGTQKRMEMQDPGEGDSPGDPDGDEEASA
eukprot:CAMPEP_0182868010 /NCGR_PEP_ID=MMETSP0034_2-20130328/9061_1 /TAXON_ID=156128 /ORGANISM="Nephroselmis pyriformis, Strain CCMP717" /LENGTH=111 /DNA_ID=CAMNT_0025000397 /DNA_START=13 /DNA_END=345 /DNA_ORIENTATION=-